MTPQELNAMKLALECAERCEAIDGMYSWSATITAIKEVLAEHAMKKVQRLGQEIEPDDIASILACRNMLDAQPVPEVDRVIWPERPWVGLTNEESEYIAGMPVDAFTRILMTEAKLKEKNT